MPASANALWREATNSPETRVRSVIRSSAIPWPKKSCSGSLDMLVKGRTAIDGRSGRNGAAAGASARPSTTR